MKTLLVWILGFLAIVTTALAPSSRAHAERGPRLILLETWKSGQLGGTEVLSVQASTKRMAVTQRVAPSVVILDLADPGNPVEIRRLPVSAAANEEMTSVAFHPSADFVFAVMNRKDPHARGRVLVMNATTGRVVADHATGYSPDHVAVAPQGDVAVVVDEGEQFWFDRRTMTFHSMAGGFTLIDLTKGCPSSSARSFGLKDQTGREGFVKKEHDRSFDRAVDLNGNGTIEPNEEGVPVPLSHNKPSNLEPEYVAFSPDGRRAFITLQENNGVVVIDPRARKNNVVAVYGLGTTTHVADTDDDGQIVFDDDLVALREPDGIVVTPDGRHFLTADEGDTDPKASDTNRGLPTGGGRTVSVFDAETGALVGDTGNQIDAAAAAAGVYPDKRSDSKGSEPENVVAWVSDGQAFAAVSLERANAVALVSLSDPADPQVVGVFAVDRGSVGPEGLAIFRDDAGRLYLYAANEVSGDVAVFQFRMR